MFKVRVLAGVVLLAAAGLLLPAAPSSAVGKLVAAMVTCDPATGVVTTTAVGAVSTRERGQVVTVHFRRFAQTVTQNAVTSLPQQTFTAKTLVDRAGDIAVAGYRTSFDPATTLWHQETTEVRVMDRNNVLLNVNQGSCRYDARTTITADCDPAANSFGVTVTGRNALGGAADGAGRPTRLAFSTERSWQQTANDLRLSTTTHRELTVSPTIAADGTWTDTTYRRAFTEPWYYYSNKVTVELLDVFGRVVGTGSVRCVLADGPIVPNWGPGRPTGFRPFGNGVKPVPAAPARGGAFTKAG